ncbi:leukocyte surface antigen CD53 isoform X3 [Haplochromis burtoni]|nr:leukocyte surface antigen CD53 isoform X3 [Haplochromis burtoni]
MTSACVNCLKSLVTALHFLCWLSNAFVVAFGEFMMMHSRFASLVTSFWPVYPANTLVVTGTIAACVCYLGVVGGMRENRCMLISFYVLLSFLISVELAMACVFFVYNREIGTYFEKDLMHSLEVYKISGPGENQTLKDDFDAIQYLFKCCGVHGVADWGGNVPISCCTLDPCNVTDQPNWQEGCVGKLQDWFAKNYLSTAAGVVSMFILQFLCMSITLPLFCCFAVRGQGY